MLLSLYQTGGPEYTEIRAQEAEKSGVRGEIRPLWRIMARKQGKTRTEGGISPRASKGGTPMDKDARRRAAEGAWLRYFNRALREQGLQDETAWRRMELEIRKISGEGKQKPV